MTTVEELSRRTVLAGAGGVGLTAVLAACGSSGSGGDTAETDGAGDGTAAGQDLAAVADVPVGGAISAEVGSAPILVTQPVEGEIRAFDAVCTHQGCTVLPADGELDCPCHGSRFDLSTGEVLGGPAPAPLPEVAVTVTDGRVVTA